MTTPNDASPDTFGELRRLTNSFDWSRTPLGPMDRWPQSLRTVVDTMLSSRFSMWMAWGPELTFFYNDAYRRDTIGVKHPWALGSPASKVWSEIWTDLEPRVRAVLEDGIATWDEALLLFLERSGYPEETYHTFSYSPLRDDRGKVEGMLCVVTEDTDRVIGERRLALLGALATELSATTREAEVMASVSQSLETDTQDVPFAAMYLFDGDVARLAATSGIPHGSAVAPEVIALSPRADLWPLSSVRDSGRSTIINDLSKKFASVPTGAWSIPPDRATIVPIAQRAQETPAGCLIVGLNPYRPLDAAYSGFIDLIAGQIGSSLANARSYEEERRRAEALAEIDRAKTTFFSNVSHEFRTPLTLLLGPMEDALTRPLEPTVKNDLELAHRNGLRLLKLVNTMLDFARAESGRMRATYEPMDLASLTADLAGSFRSATERAGLALNVDTPPLSAPVYVDLDMWEKIVLNLLSNAFKHTFTGGITVALSERDGEALLKVQDTGIGISEDELPKIFDRFHRVENAKSRTHEGTGIGLALVQELVTRHGGTIAVESTPGHGTTFTVSLPMGTAHLPADRISAAGSETRRTSAIAAPFIEEALRWLPDAGAPAPIATPETGGARILLADDNADMRDYVARLLRERGWTVDAVADGAEAVDAALANPPDLVLSDVMMPKLDGFGLLARLRGESQTQTIPVVLLSARAGEEARVEAAHAGADDYLVKPFAAQELVARVGVHLALAKQRRIASETMARARDLLTSVLEQAPVGICVMRGDPLVYELANAAYRELLPKDKPVIGQRVGTFAPSEQVTKVLGHMEEVRRTGIPWIGRAVEIIYDRHGRGPEPAYLNVLYYPFMTGGEIVDGVIAVVSEVTDEVLARREAEVARADAETANRAKSQFLAVMSHELRTPLNAIAGHLQLLEMGLHGPVTEPQREAMGRIDRSQRHLLALINDVLNLARIEMGRVDYRIESIGAADAIATIEPMIQPQILAKGLKFSKAVDQSLAVRADHEKLSQILLNLVGNSVKFTESPGAISLRVRAEGAMIAFDVADTGQGISPDKLLAIFEPFVQVHTGPTRRSEGAGLGLAISRDLARGMGGDITVVSNVGKGSTFTLLLPSA